MIPLKKLFEIQEFALSNAFDVKISPDETGNIEKMCIEFGDRELEYRACNDSITVKDIRFDGNYENFVAEMNLLRIIEMIAKMLQENIVSEGE